jgi:hypothetical protein
MKMKKSQIISMDFIMTFVVYVFALSVFFFAMQNALLYDSPTLDVPSELLFSRLYNTYTSAYDFLDGSKVDDIKLDNLLAAYNPNKGYEFFFKDFEDAALFQKIDYCIYLEDKTAVGTQVLINFAAYTNSSKAPYSIYITGNVLCGTENKRLYTNAKPHCNSTLASESIVLTKPVLYGRELINLKVLICAKKR